MLKPGTRTRVRMLCFPFAGGSASFARAWRTHLPAHIELLGVQYPGRDSRAGEPLERNLHGIVDRVFDDIVRLMDLPFVFVGYSLGALIAYETSIRLTQHGLLPPLRLVVAASRAPHLARESPQLSALPEPEFLARLRQFGGTPESVLADADLMQLFLPILRADFSCAENYSPTPFMPLPCPITAMHGMSDPTVDESAVAAWQQHTASDFRLHRIDGGHFFLQERLNDVMYVINRLTEFHVGSDAMRRVGSH